MPVDHYENFPVASLLIPPRLREPVEAIYAFARSADDIADEGDAPPEKRLEQLDTYRSALDDIERNGVTAARGLPPFFARLARAISRNDLPLKPFHDLLAAFRQDVEKNRYADFNELADYCRRSANPVGRLLLSLFGATEKENYLSSDCLCTGLQLTNFLQDVAIDWKKGRLYLPREDLERFKVSEEDIAAARCDERWQALLAFEVERARASLSAGASLARRLPGRIGWELRLIVASGMRVLERIEAVGYDVFARRPVLGLADKLVIVWRALNYPRARA